MFKTVSKIIDGDTFEVKESWNWKEQKGDRVRPTGFDTPEKGEPGFEAATQKLSRLILGKQVELKDCVTVDRGRLVCKVLLQTSLLGGWTDIADLMKK